MRIDRRKTLGLLGAGMAGSAAAASASALSKAAGSFNFGVASGDPSSDRVILWTRLDGTPGSAVLWEVAEDADFKTPVAHGKSLATAERDMTIKVDVAGLRPGRDYHYRFRTADGVVSPLGRTRTLPVGPTKDVVLAVANCSLYPNGYFNAYGAIAALARVDAVLHLGDYIYEYGGPGTYGMDSAVAHERPHDPPHDCVTLDDYRRRHAQYKTDPQLQAAHARAPWIVVWDDHESANDSWIGGAENHRPATEGDWNLRKAAAIKAYYEWMPIREPVGGGFAIYRSFDFGDVASLFMFETRLTARDHQLYLTELPPQPTDADIAAFRKRVADPARKMMSAGQEAWLSDGLKASVRSGRPWQVLGNQVVMAQLLVPSFRDAVGPDYPRVVAGMSPHLASHVQQSQFAADHDLPYGMDSWEGYPADRERLYRILQDARANCVVVSGDSHAFWANELHADSGAGRRVAVEFGTTAITSPGDGDYFKDLPLGEMFVKRNQEVRFCDQSAKGFVLLTLSHEAAVGELMAVSTIVEATYETKVLKRYRATPGPEGVSALTEI
jgi:alkaline phosphatase D